MGLGLSTAKELTHCLCGGISLTSNKGEGTDVSFSVQVRNQVDTLRPNDLKSSTLEFSQAFGDILFNDNNFISDPQDRNKVVIASTEANTQDCKKTIL